MSITRSQRAILFQRLLPKTEIAGALQRHVLFICCERNRREIVGSERLWGKQVENKERYFQVSAKGKYARTRVCLTMKTIDLKRFMLRFILNDFGDNHHLRSRDISPENIGRLIAVIRVVSNCFRSWIVTFLACKVTYKIVFLCNVYVKEVGDQNLWSGDQNFSVSFQLAPERKS